MDFGSDYAFSVFFEEETYYHLGSFVCHIRVHVVVVFWILIAHWSLGRICGYGKVEVEIDSVSFSTVNVKWNEVVYEEECEREQGKGIVDVGYVILDRGYRDEVACGPGNEEGV